MFDTRQENEVTVLTLQGKRLDAALAPRFRNEVLQLVNDGAHRLVLDLANVEFMDSSGLGALVSVLKGIGNRGRMAVCNAQGSVRQLFQLTRMDKVFPILPDTAAAVAAVRG